MDQCMLDALPDHPCACAVPAQCVWIIVVRSARARATHTSCFCSRVSGTSELEPMWLTFGTGTACLDGRGRPPLAPRPYRCPPPSTNANAHTSLLCWGACGLWLCRANLGLAWAAVYYSQRGIGCQNASCQLKWRGRPRGEPPPSSPPRPPPPRCSRSGPMRGRLRRARHRPWRRS